MITNLAQLRGRKDYFDAIGWPLTNPDKWAGSRLPQPAAAPGTWPDVLHRLKNNEPRIDTIHWGYRPAWAVEKDLPVQTTAPLENILMKPYYTGLMSSGRCIVPVDAWYVKEGEGKQARRRRQCREDGQLLFLAAVAVWQVYGSQPPGAGFVIVTNNGLPADLNSADARQWMDLRVPADQAANLVRLRKNGVT